MKKLMILVAAAGVISAAFTACATHESDNSPQPTTQGDGGRGESPAMKAKTSSGVNSQR